ncbi:MAG: glycosyltransferase family 2 protein [Planctomycetota bacterium]
MASWQVAALGAYLTILGLLSIYGLHRYHLIWLYYRHRRRRELSPPETTSTPRVTVQLPLFNEACVAERLIDAVAALRYAPGRLEIQVLDDSTDDTRDLVARKVAELRATGVDIVHLHRENRLGFKAGALEAGLAQASGELIAVFDADFVPESDFLLATVPFFENADIGMVQTRWGHLNAPFSLLTRVQAMLLDAHFIFEHFPRNRGGRFFNFNGTAGVWRRRCIEESGGWQHDTLTEDLDLSYRAQLQGWRFLFLPDVVAPAELPIDMAAFKSQQHRWAKGSVQTAMKLLPKIWASEHPLRVKLEATFHLSANFAYLLVLLLCLLMPLVSKIRLEHATGWVSAGIDVSIAIAAFASVLFFYSLSQSVLYPRWWARLIYLPALLCIGVGLSINNARAVFEALSRKQGHFVRTPKHHVVGRQAFSPRYRARTSWQIALELTMAAWCGMALAPAIRGHYWLLAAFVSIFLVGFAWVGGKSAIEGVRSRALATA